MSVCSKCLGRMVPLLLLSPTSLMAKEVDSWYRSPTFLGRGGAGIADPRDEDAMFYNPAGLYHSESIPKKNSAAVEKSTEPAPDVAGEEKTKDEKEQAKDEKEKAPTSSEETQAGNSGGFRKAVVLSPLITLSDTVREYTSVGSDDTKMLRTLRDNVGKPVHAGVDNFSGVLYGNFGVGLVASMHANFYVYRDPDNSGIEAVNLAANQNMGLATSYGYGLLGDRLQLGATAKYLKRTTTLANISIASLDDVQNFSITKYQNYGNGMGLDLGMIYKLEDPLGTKVAVHLADLGDTHFKRAKKEGFAVDDMKQTLGVGLTMAPVLPVGKTTISFDLTDIMGREDDNRLKNIHIGADYLLADLIGFAAGINQGFSTWGAYVTTRLFRMDIGSYGEEVGDRIGERSSRRYYLRLIDSF